MFPVTGEVLDLWKGELGEPHWLYFLIDPRSSSVCYVGITRQKPAKRLRQHRSPKPSNMTAIAKLQRFLISENMTLDMQLVVKGSEDLISLYEKLAISGFRSRLGAKSIKNHQSGGRDAYKNSSESTKKTWETNTKRRASGEIVALKGEGSPSSKVTEKQVLEIYTLINGFYANGEILDMLDLPIGMTGLNQIRQGKNWQELFKREGMSVIPSMNVVKGALNSREKLEVLGKIEEGVDFQILRKEYGLSVTDLKRIADKVLWKMSWNVFSNYYKTSKLINNK